MLLFLYSYSENKKKNRVDEGQNYWSKRHEITRVSPLRATMFHAVGLNVIERREMYRDVADAFTSEDNIFYRRPRSSRTLNSAERFLGG